MKKKGRKLVKRVFAIMLALIMAVPTVDYGALSTVEAAGTDITVKASGGYEEGAYVEWEPVAGANGYIVSVSEDHNAWTIIDDELIRGYGTYFRADALGLTAGDWDMKIEAVPIANGETGAPIASKVVAVNVTAHDRSGYGWQGNGTASGAYNNDGSLRDGTNVVYITEASKNTVQLTVNGKSYTGLPAILSAYKNEKTKPLDVRIMGNITDLAFPINDKGDLVVENGNNSVGITIEGVGEDTVVNGWGIRLKSSSNVEIRNLGFMNCDSDEGDNVGLQQANDHIWVHNCDFFYGKEGKDEDQKKGDGMLDCKQGSDWITFSYNHFWDSGKSSLLGYKEAQDFHGHITYHHNWFDHSDSRHPRVRAYTAHVYNNYYDGNAKYGIGAAEGAASVFAENNYFRKCKYPMLISQQGSDVSGTFSGETGSMIKAYGNIIEGATRFIKYSAASASADVQSDSIESSEFVPYVDIDDDKEEKFDTTEENTDGNEDEVLEADGEENFDENEKVESDVNAEDTDSEDEAENPDSEVEEVSNEAELVSEIVESVILSNDNHTYDYSYPGDPVEFDAYVASTKDEQVPASVITKNGGFSYNNFDTAADFYTYRADSAEDVPEIVEAHAGRVNGGDLKHEFDNDVDDSSYAVNTELQSKLLSYETSLISVGGVNGASIKVYYKVTFDPGNGDNTWTEQVEANTAVAEPTAPTTLPSGKVTFDCWNKGSRKWNFENVVTEDMTLVGQWLAAGEDPSEYGRKTIGDIKVTHDFTAGDFKDSPYFDIVGSFDTQSGGSGTYEDKKYNSGNGKGRLDLRAPATIEFTTSKVSKLILFLDPFRSGGAMIDTKSYTPSSGIIEIIIPAGDHAITRNGDDFMYAIWVVPFSSDTKFTITVDKADGSDSPTTSFTVDVGSNITSDMLPTPTKEGFKFNGWKDSNGNIITLPYMPLDNMTLTATWIKPDELMDMAWKASDIAAGTYESNVEKNGFTVTATKDKTVIVEAKNAKVDNVSYTSVLKTGGTGDATSRSIKFTTKAAADLYIVVASASTGNDRTMIVAASNAQGGLVNYESDYIVDGGTTTKYNGGITVKGDGAHSYALRLNESGVYYVYSKSSGINFYAVKVTYDKTTDPQPGTYTVTFNTNGGTAVASQTVESGQKCTKPTDPTKEGCTFAGWYTDSACTAEYNFDTTTVTANITLYAKWTPEGSTGTSYTVTFNTNGGTAVAVQTVETGQKCPKPTDPTKEGCTFAGWYTDSACTEGNEYNFDTTTVTGNITLYAKWTDNGTENPTTYKVTFDTDGGSAVAEQTVESGNKCPKPADPTKTGCTFAGWYTDSECTEGHEYDFDNTTVTGNITLYAKWTDNTEPPEEPGLHIDFVNKNETYTYTGSAIKPEIVVTNVTDNGKIVLVEGVDYTVRYANNINASEDVTAPNKQPTITVTGKGIYAGKAAPKQFTIKKKSLKDADIKVGRILVVDNTKASMPVLYYGSMKLTTKNFKYKDGYDKNKKFRLSEVNPIIPIEGINNFKDECDITVEVVENRTELNKKTLKFKVEYNTAKLSQITYNGSSQEENIKECIKKVSDKTTGTDIDKNKYAIAFSGNVTDAGTVKFTIVGLEEYSGCNVVKSCRIQPKAITEAVENEADAGENKVLIKGMGSKELDYVSTGAVFDNIKLTWITGSADGSDSKNTKLELKAGRDYNLSYSGNKKVGSTAKLNIAFKGNYKGRVTPLSFTIAKAELSADTVKADDIIIADKVCNAKNGVGVSGVYKSAPYVSMDGVMVKASEYDVKYYTKEAMGTADEMTAQNKLTFESGQPYATVYVKITPKPNSKNYKASTDADKAAITSSYKVWVRDTNKVDLSRASVLFYKDKTDIRNTTRLEYTGNAVNPGKIEVKVGRNPVTADKYEYKIINKVNKGKATVLIKAKDGTDAIGAKVVTYNIVSHNVGGFIW